MVIRDLVPHDALIDRFELAVDWYSMDSRAEEIPKYVKNLHRVERDIYAIDIEKICNCPIGQVTRVLFSGGSGDGSDFMVIC